MSRSNPQENGTPNPAVRWFEWNGEAGTVRYYDKDAKQNVDVGSDFLFVLLDQLGSVRGWHEASQSGIYSNEVKDTRQDAMIVKAFKAKAPLAEGIYKDIKDRVNAVGGQFVASCYIAFKYGEKMAIGNLRFKGAALGSWMEFCKQHRADLFKKAVRIHGFTEGKKGRIIYRMPILEIAELSPQSDAAATALDRTLQEFLSGYLKKNKRDQVETSKHVGADEPTEYGGDEDYDDATQDYDEHNPPPITDDDIPF